MSRHWVVYQNSTDLYNLDDWHILESCHTVTMFTTLTWHVCLPEAGKLKQMPTFEVAQILDALHLCVDASLYYFALSSAIYQRIVPSDWDNLSYQTVDLLMHGPASSWLLSTTRLIGPAFLIFIKRPLSWGISTDVITRHPYSVILICLILCETSINFH